MTKSNDATNKPTLHADDRTSKSFATRILAPLGVLAFAASLVASPATAQAFCPTSGCQASVHELLTGGHVLQASSRKVSSGLGLLEHGEVARVRLNGEIIAEPLITRYQVSYICCCAPEQLSEITMVFDAELAPGDTLSVEFPGECTAEAVIPAHVLRILRSGVLRQVGQNDDGGALIRAR